jgi:hypothetical protein
MCQNNTGHIGKGHCAIRCQAHALWRLRRHAQAKWWQGNGRGDLDVVQLRFRLHLPLATLMVGIRSPDGLVVGLAPATLEFWVRFPNERNQGKQGATLC